MQQLIKAIEEAKTEDSNFNLSYCGISGEIYLCFFKGGRLIDSSTFAQGRLDDAVKWVRQRQEKIDGSNISDYINAFEQGGQFNGRPERQWLSEFLTQFDDWLLSEPEKTRRLLLHMFNGEWHDLMIDRIQHHIDCDITEASRD